MSIVQLPVFEADADPHHRLSTAEEILANRTPPESIVVRFGRMGMIGEFEYSVDSYPTCGSQFVARTQRGTEIVTMLSTTCSKSQCDQSLDADQIESYINESGGNDYPFFTEGKILRAVTSDDLNKNRALNSEKQSYLARCKERIQQHDLPMNLIDVEPILGEELLTFYYMAEDRVDFRKLVRVLAGDFATRIELRQVGARDEARLVADYERCGQFCCCKNFLKVLQSVSMKSAKVQKATLDPLKISGRCGRLMCCLRYEDQTYKELRANLPHRKTRVGTSEGPGIVVDSRVLVQLVLVKLEHDAREIAVPVDELLDPDECPPPGSIAVKEMDSGLLPDPLQGLEVEVSPTLPDSESEKESTSPTKRRTRRSRRRKRGKRGGRQRNKKADSPNGEKQTSQAGQSAQVSTPSDSKTGQKSRRRKSRRGRRGRGSQRKKNNPPSQ